MPKRKGDIRKETDKLFSLHTDKLRTVLNRLTDEQTGEVIRLLADYQEGNDVKTPKDKLIGFAYEILQQSLIALNEKRALFSEAQRNRANSRWNNRKGINSDSEEFDESCRGISGNAENANKVKVKEKVKEKEKEKDSSLNNINIKSGGSSQHLCTTYSQQPPLEIINQIKEESKSQEFFIDNKIAKIFLNCGFNNEWFYGPFSFLEYCAVSIKKKYSEKDNAELKSLYISAVKEWEDMRDSYPQWKKKKEAEEIKKALNAKTENIFNNPPKCECGNQIQNTYHNYARCDGCFANYEFDYKKIEWRKGQ